MPLAQKEKTVFASKRFFASLHCRASLAFSRSSTCTCGQKIGSVGFALAVFVVELIRIAYHQWNQKGQLTHYQENIFQNYRKQQYAIK
ncbi:hypothetical protein NVZ35_002664 [Salmonella enterica]|uniref:hypothetical protein n=1 Tax=Salmonella enterica TaxID=28901 RepID=UPI00198D7D82|nr:hypothetical protein [Salmonella enterica]EGR9583685.1 hypothetical protein [Salmonella enterica subsp. enterica serovar Carmel]HBM0008356.1 hypothetical protein [Salmonella enterica subsp. enterica serovar Dahra]HED0069061.1 hypothetical protein [Salmonella enterica subsp. enterica serovar Matadi]EEE5377535.1 hypothetical protein [Salmonella enterica subsp. enterica serovar Uzaramo]EEE9945515.1 hypothetical protein [Salmonella enterica subsp. enterica serovar Uzaramo]